MLLPHLPAHGGTPTAISFPRDSWVDIPGYGKGKLNSAFCAGRRTAAATPAGSGSSSTPCQNMTGLTVDHFVRVSLLGFYDIAKALGPVQVCLNHPARDSYSGIDLPAGVSTLDAKQALAFVRQRHHLPRGDLDREVRQQYFLSAELHKIVSAGTLLNPAKQQQLLSAVSSAMQTDTGLDLLDLACRMQGRVPGQGHLRHDPDHGTPTSSTPTATGVSIVAVDLAAMPAFINRITGQPERLRQGGPGRPRVGDRACDQRQRHAGARGRATPRPLSGPRVQGAARRPTGPGRPTPPITYPTGMEAQAKAVAAHVPGAAVSRLVLGHPGHRHAGHRRAPGVRRSRPRRRGRPGAVRGRRGRPHPRPRPPRCRTSTGRSCIN